MPATLQQILSLLGDKDVTIFTLQTDMQEAITEIQRLKVYEEIYETLVRIKNESNETE